MSVCGVSLCTCEREGEVCVWAWQCGSVFWLIFRLALWLCRFHTAKNRPPYSEIVSSTNAATEIPIIFTFVPIFVLYMCSSVQS